MYEPIIIILDNIGTVDTLIFLDISIVNTNFLLNNYYLFDLIVFIISISSITNYNIFKRYPYSYFTNSYLYIIRLNFGIFATIYIEDKNDYNLINRNY